MGVFLSALTNGFVSYADNQDYIYFPAIGIDVTKTEVRTSANTYKYRSSQLHDLIFTGTTRTRQYTHKQDIKRVQYNRVGVETRGEEHCLALLMELPEL